MITISDGNFGITRFKKSHVLERLLSPAPTFDLHLSESLDGELIKNYIANHFKAVHGARIKDFMPQFLTMSCQGKLCSVAGLRPASLQDLFLEQYSEQKIETVVGQLGDIPVDRSQILEIGNLVATQRGSSQLIFLILSAILQATPYQWTVFTASPQVHRIMQRMGLQLHYLYDADPSRLTNTHLSDWGRYYENRPCVVAVKICEAFTSLTQRTFYSKVVSLYQSRINYLIPLVNTTCTNEQSSFPA